MCVPVYVCVRNPFFTLNRKKYKQAKPPGSQYTSTAAGGHEIHILSLMQNSSHSEEGKGWVGCPAPHCSSRARKDVELFTQSGRKRVGRVGGGVSCSSLLISSTKLIAAQQQNETDFHRCMPAKLKLVPA